MDVRCVRCRRAVSEWAGRCPGCHADLAGAPPIPEPAAPPEPAPTQADAPAERPQVERPQVERPPAEPTERLAADPPTEATPMGATPTGRRRSGPVLLGALALVAVVIAGVVVAGDVTAHHPRHARRTSSGTVPSAAGPAPEGPGVPALSSVATAAAERLRGQRLFVAEGTTTEAELADGTVLQRVGMSSGYPSQPVVAGPDSVAYLDDGSAYSFDIATGAHPVRLGPASAILSAGPDRVDLVSTIEGGQVVTRIGPHDATTRMATLPSSLQPVGISSLGVVAEAPDGNLVLPATGDRGARVVTGEVSSVVAVAGDEVAWTSAAGCSAASRTDCPLHLTDVRTGTDRTVRLGAVAGWVGIGTFSPDGRTLAVFGLPDTATRSGDLEMATVDVATGVATGVGLARTSGPATPTVTWSPGGEWLFFGGAGGFEVLDFAPPNRSLAPDDPQPLPLHVTCCVVSF